MKNLCLCGKQYNDTVLLVEDFAHGTTNQCSDVLKQEGGTKNLLQVDYQNFRPEVLNYGLKDAYIVSNLANANRTSFVFTKTESKLTQNDLKFINGSYDWIHFSYIDDFEDLISIKNININYSIDFCTESSRHPYVDIIDNAKIVFDSRERKHLYSNINSQTPIVLHDPYGLEIISVSAVIYSNSMTPISNLHVNGAGDIFAGITIDNYFNNTLSDACNIAMKETTNILRCNNEKI